MNYNFWMKKLPASVILIAVLASPAHNSQVCDDKCPAYRLESVGLPIPSTAYWWPGPDQGEFSFQQDDQQLTYHLPEHLRNQWHEVQLSHHNITDDATPPGSFILSIPTLNQTRNVTCQDSECLSMKIFTPESAWSLGCEGAPCGCPSYMRYCLSQKVLSDECKEVSLFSLQVPLDSSYKVYWLPKQTGILYLEYGDTTQGLRIHHDCVDTWVEIEVKSRFVTEESSGSIQHVCDIILESWEFVGNCSGVDVVSLSSKGLEVFALGCQEDPRGALGRGVSTSVIIAASIASVFLALFIIRRTRRCRRKPTSAVAEE